MNTENIHKVQMGPIKPSVTPKTDFAKSLSTKGVSSWKSGDLASLGLIKHDV